MLPHLLTVRAFRPVSGQGQPAEADKGLLRNEFSFLNSPLSFFCSCNRDFCRERTSEKVIEFNKKQQNNRYTTIILFQNNLMQLENFQKRHGFVWNRVLLMI